MSKNTRLLLIDGENFVHGLLEVLKSARLIKNRDQLSKIDMGILLSPIASGPIKVSYYTTRIQMPHKKHKLFQKAESMRQWNSRWIPFLANQGVEFIRSGFLKIRDSKVCYNCGKKTEILLEKGVDVRLGVDIVDKASNTAVIYVWSSDSDLIPAFEAAKHKGASVVYVAIEGMVNNALKMIASQTVIVNKASILKAFRGATNGQA